MASEYKLSVTPASGMKSLSNMISAVLSSFITFSLFMGPKDPAIDHELIQKAKSFSQISRANYNQFHKRLFIPVSEHFYWNPLRGAKSGSCKQ